MAQTVKKTPVMQKTWVPSLGWDPLEKGMATHSCIFLPGEFHGERSLAGYSLRGCKELVQRHGLQHARPVLTNIFNYVSVHLS